MITSKVRQVTLPAEMCEEAERRFAAHFANVEELLAFVLDRLLHDEAGEMNRAEELMIEQRLRDLGYM